MDPQENVEAKLDTTATTEEQSTEQATTEQPTDDTPQDEEQPAKELDLEEEHEDILDYDVEEEEPSTSAPAEATPPEPLLSWTKISNLTRPFSLAGLKRTITENSDSAKIEEFWINQIKSVCYVTLSDHKASSEKLISNMNDTTWPESNPKKLAIKLASQQDKEDDVYMDENDGKLPPRIIQEQKDEKERNRKRKIEERDAERAAKIAADKEKLEKDCDTLVKNEEGMDKKADARDRLNKLDEERNTKEADSGSRRLTPKRARAGSPRDLREEARHIPSHEIYRPTRSPIRRMGEGFGAYAGKERKPSASAEKPARPVRERSPTPDIQVPPRLDTEELGDLFRLTDAEPRIYWRPNTEKEIQEREEKRIQAEEAAEQKRLEKEAAKAAKTEEQDENQAQNSDNEDQNRDDDEDLLDMDDSKVGELNGVVNKMEAIEA